MASTFLNLDQLNQAGGIEDSVKTLPGIISTLLPIVFSLAGIILLGMIIVSGFTMLFGVSNPDQAEKAKKTLTSSIIGFVIIIAAYWIAQILETIFALPIVSSN